MTTTADAGIRSSRISNLSHRHGAGGDDTSVDRKTAASNQFPTDTGSAVARVGTGTRFRWSLGLVNGFTIHEHNREPCPKKEKRMVRSTVAFLTFVLAFGQAG